MCLWQLEYSIVKKMLPIVIDYISTLFFFDKLISLDQLEYSL